MKKVCIGLFLISICASAQVCSHVMSRYPEGDVLVYKNGILQTVDVDYTLVAGSTPTIAFNTPPVFVTDKLSATTLRSFTLVTTVLGNPWTGVGFKEWREDWTCPLAPPPPAPGPVGPITRTVAGCPIGYGDMYWNSPVDKLPVVMSSNAMIVSLGVGNLWPSPEFTLNIADNSTPATPSYLMQWDQTNPMEFDSGSYPMVPSTQVSLYLFGHQTPISGGPYTGNDDHVLMLNKDTCLEYETYNLQNNAPPYHNSTGTIVDWQDYRMRTAQKFITVQGDSAGMDNGTASGIPIWPMVLTHVEVFGGQPIVHGFRIALTNTQTAPTYQWPATHGCCTQGTTNINMGATFRLKASFDTNTCHYKDNTGLAFPAWMKNVLTAFQTYGMYDADNSGQAGSIATDTDQGWGDTSLPTSDNWIFAGWLHCVQLSDLEVVDNTPRVISVTSGQIQTFIPR
jgi:hypothetical protein